MCLICVGFNLNGDDWFPTFCVNETTSSIVVDETIVDETIGEVAPITVEVGAETVAPVTFETGALEIRFMMVSIMLEGFA
jgi:hypothetical protein